MYFVLIADQLEEIRRIQPLPGYCPATVGKWLAKRSQGDSTDFQGDRSDVVLHIPDGSVKGVHKMRIHTDHSKFIPKDPEEETIVGRDECIIAPIIDVRLPPRQNTAMYTVRIPHCLDENHDKSLVKVRMGDIYKQEPFIELPHAENTPPGQPCYEFTSGGNFILVHSPHFCQIICSICKVICPKRTTVFFYGAISSSQEGDQEKNNAEIRPYFCSMLCKIQDFQMVCV